jgi:serine O-acetyltransferase
MDGSGNPSAVQRARSAYFRFRKRACTPLAAIALSSSQRELVRADTAKWAEFSEFARGAGVSELDYVAILLARDPAFRNLLYYRLSHGTSARMELLVPFLRRIWKPLPSLRLAPDSLGPGCFILHGRETGIVARSIGSGFVVGQHVVIGFSAGDKCPTIGDDVSVSVGAIVIGDIKIGNDVMVGAGAVVVRDVAPETRVMGVPARVG